MSRNVYLDHAAATPLDERVFKAMQSYLKDEFYNPSSLYESARKTRQAVETARATVADTLGAKKSEIIFTAGATESVNLAIFGVMRALSPKRPSVIPSKVEESLLKESSLQSGMLRQAQHDGQLKLVTTAIEHEAVLACIPALERDGHAVEVVPVKPDGIVDLVALENAIDDQTVLVSVMYANNEIGTIQPLAEIGKMIAQVRASRTKRSVKMPIYFHSDATQAPNYLDIHVSRLGVDLMTLNGSKIYGPKQTGCLYIRTGVPLEPVIYGGGQEKGLRSGTENVAGIIGFAEALKLTTEIRDEESKRLTELRDRLISELSSTITDIQLNGHAGKRLANNINLIIPDIDGEATVLHLDREGFQVSTGSACTTGNTDPSHVLLAIGRSTTEANASLRLTLGRSTTAHDLDELAKTLPKIVERLRKINT
jgi:cysteine desulfurase